MERCLCCGDLEPLPYTDRHGSRTCTACHDGLCGDPDSDPCRKVEALRKYEDLRLFHEATRNGARLSQIDLDRDVAAAIRSIKGEEPMQ